MSDLFFAICFFFNFGIYLARGRFFLLYFLLVLLFISLFLLFEFLFHRGFWGFLFHKGFWDFWNPFRLLLNFGFLFGWLDLVLFLILDELLFDNLLLFDFLSFRIFVESRSLRWLGQSYRFGFVCFILPLPNC